MYSLPKNVIGLSKFFLFSLRLPPCKFFLFVLPVPFLSGMSGFLWMSIDLDWVFLFDSKALKTRLKVLHAGMGWLADEPSLGRTDFELGFLLEAHIQMSVYGWSFLWGCLFSSEKNPLTSYLRGGCVAGVLRAPYTSPIFSAMSASWVCSPSSVSLENKPLIFLERGNREARWSGHLRWAL